MISCSVNIINKLGLHARASAKLVALAARFHSEIEITKNHHRVNGKSIMAVMMLAASQGSCLELKIDGPDEAEMAEAIVNLINNRFDETE